MEKDEFVGTTGKSNDYFLKLCSVGESIWMEAGNISNSGNQNSGFFFFLTALDFLFSNCLTLSHSLAGYAVGHMAN